MANDHDQKDGPRHDTDREPSSETQGTTISFTPEAQGTTKSILPPEQLPSTIGNYRIIQKIGAGGMGVVYEAEQQQPRRLVALKVIRGGRFVDDHQVRLFEREAQALARLKHPGIATIYESGRTPDGEHFFAMELVQGETLKKYIENTAAGEPLTPGKLLERLAIFRKISDAVTYAHQRGVIHRDLKPSNIIVQSEFEASDARSDTLAPGIKILDFGLARITEADLAVATIGTEVGMIQGTLPYMSPEQVRGNPDEIDVRSDVYSLGVILYEMIAGRRPYDVHQAMIHEAARVICETPPAPLSKSWKGTKRLDRDLETIVVKALEKPAARRYQSVSALAEDISRFLTGQPILARPPSAIYQLQKLAKRHRLGFGFAASLIVLIAAFAVLMSIQAERIARERDRANREARTSHQVSEFLVSLFEISDPFEGRGKDVKAREILDSGSARIASELKDQPEIQATLSNTMGRVYGNLGIYDKAIELVQAGLEIRERQAGQDSLEVAASLDNLGELKLEKGDYPAAEELIRKGYEIRRKILGAENIDVAESLNNLGSLYYHEGEWSKSESLFREALRIQRKVLGGEDLSVADSLNNLAMVLKEQDKYVEAMPLYEEALSIKRKKLGSNHPLVAQSVNNLGVLYLRVKNYSEAEKLFQEALSINRKALGNTHPDVSANLNNLAQLNLERGQLAKAEAYFRQVIALDRKNFGENNPQLAHPVQSLGVVLAQEKKFTEAEENLRRALSLKLLQFDRNHFEVATTNSLLGACLADQKKYKEAEPLLIESYEIIKNQFGVKHDRTQKAGSRLVALYQAWGKNDKAAMIQAELGISR
jgi:serine/threonine protein kinase/Tfp pilus assembly protein PilF